MSSKYFHLHPLAALLSALKLLKELIIPFAVLLVTKGLQGASERQFFWIIAGGGVFLLLVLVWGLLSWRRFTYHVEDGELRVERGVFIRKRTFIPRERIQTVDLSQGLLQRVFGVVTVKVETAGGMKPEALLTAVSMNNAERLRQLLLVSREPESGKQHTASENVKVFSNRDLLIFGVTSGGSFGIAFSFLSGGFAIIDDLNYSNFNANNLLSWIWESGHLLFFAAGALAGIWLLALAGIVAYYGGFTITRTKDRLQITHGFLQRRQVSIPIRRIQAICLVEGILRQPFGFVALRVESAGFAVKGGKKLLLWPLLHRDQVTGFLEQYVPEFAQNFELNALPPGAGRRYALGLMLPLALVVLPLSWWFSWGKYALLLLPLSLLWGLWRFRDAGWAINGDMLALRFRILNRTTALIPRRCAQSFTISVSPLQRRAGLAGFNIPLASGTAFGLVHISKFDGDKLLKWVGSLRKRGRVSRENPPVNTFYP